MSDTTETTPMTPAVPQVAIKVDETRVMQTQLNVGTVNVYLNNGHAGSGGHAAPHQRKSHAGPTIAKPDTQALIARQNGTAAKPVITSNSFIEPVVSFASDGDKITTYRAKDGATAEFREDRQNGNDITTTLKDASGSVTLHSSKRGYDARYVAVDGRITYEHAKQGDGVPVSYRLGHFFEGIQSVPAVIDNITCPSKSVNALPAVTDGVTRDKAQQFLGQHKELADTLKTVKTPITLSGGRQLDVLGVLNSPTHVRACPADHPGVAVTKK